MIYLIASVSVRGYPSLLVDLFMWEYRASDYQIIHGAKIAQFFTVFIPSSDSMFTHYSFVLGKCKVMRVNARNNEAITVNGQALEDVEKFVYLGATVCKQGGGDEDIKARLGKARGAFVKLNRVWNSNSVTKKTKIKLYKTLVKPVLMYGCETWKMNEGDAQKINVFQNRCLRRILKIKWQDKVTNKELLERANVDRLSEEVRRRRWRFIGHILRQHI